MSSLGNPASATERGTSSSAKPTQLFKKNEALSSVSSVVREEKGFVEAREDSDFSSRSWKGPALEQDSRETDVHAFERKSRGNSLTNNDPGVPTALGEGEDGGLSAGAT